LRSFSGRDARQRLPDKRPAGVEQQMMILVKALGQLDGEGFFPGLGVQPAQFADDFPNVYAATKR
jgi:hypothetical protein